MNPVAIQLITSLGLAAITAWTGYALGQRQERNREQRQRALAAAESLVAPLRVLQNLVRRLGRSPVSGEEAADAFENWFAAYDACGHRLPEEWQHLPRSVRDATGTVFGGVAFVDIRPDSRYVDLAEPDWMWQDFADDYLDYCADLILRWGESSLKKTTRLKNYERWLIATERRSPRGRSRVSRPLATRVTQLM